jgi:hypothetical protein
VRMPMPSPSGSTTAAPTRRTSICWLLRAARDPDRSSTPSCHRIAHLHRPNLLVARP